MELSGAAGFDGKKRWALSDFFLFAPEAQTVEVFQRFVYCFLFAILPDGLLCFPMVSYKAQVFINGVSANISA